MSSFKNVLGEDYQMSTKVMILCDVNNPIVTEAVLDWKVFFKVIFIKINFYFY